MSDDVHEGGCFCGSIRYRTRGEPRRGLVCHCTFCQRLTGSAYVVEAIFLKEQVEITGGPIGTYEHRSDETGRASARTGSSSGRMISAAEGSTITSECSVCILSTKRRPSDRLRAEGPGVVP